MFGTLSDIAVHSSDYSPRERSYDREASDSIGTRILAPQEPLLHGPYEEGNIQGMSGVSRVGRGVGVYEHSSTSAPGGPCQGVRLVTDIGPVGSTSM
ncbi:hypothetical protein GCM10009544_32200 [Streptomyces stramineus]|uniref:Uncharacterized protein n=1 Tax=Streptomyces stramineus TaxID=173861 RepID=A0ABP3JZ64_9ACTN